MHFSVRVECGDCGKGESYQQQAIHTPYYETVLSDKPYTRWKLRGLNVIFRFKNV